MFCSVTKCALLREEAEKVDSRGGEGGQTFDDGRDILHILSKLRSCLSSLVSSGFID